MKTNTKIERVIVTGANGFIGSHLVKALCRQGVMVYGVVKDSESDITLIKGLKNLKIIYCDMDDYSQLVEKIHEDIDLFYHLAWRGVFRDDKSNYAMQAKNSINTLDAAKVSKVLGCKKFITTGTITEYAARDLHEKEYLSSNMFYGITKNYTFNMLKVFCKNNEIDFVWATLSNVYGNNNKTGNVISYIIKQLEKGHDVKVSSGEHLYDFLYIKDCVEALLLLGSKVTTRDNYFIGSGEHLSLRKYFEKLVRLLGCTEKIQYGQSKNDPIDYQERWFDTAPIAEELGFVAQYSFADGINEMLKGIGHESR